MDIAFVVAAFALGFVASLVRLPPLVGYLAAGFALHAMGYESTPAIDLLAELGVMLLLFGLGLKLRLKTLARREVWATASLHMALSTSILAAVFWVLAMTGLPLVGGLGLGQVALLGFALSFSSTVFAVKALEDRNESESLAGRLAIGILIVQDIFAVVFLVFASGELPSPWAIPVVALVVAARPVYGWILDRAGHGELLILLGFFLAIGVGAGSFDSVGIKPDLGALIVGLTLAGHPRAPELADRLLGFKDILLIGFFLSIGLGGPPDLSALLIAVGALIVLPMKGLGFLSLLPRFGLRARTSWHTSLTLTTYSEFGLIVVAAAISEGLLSQRWAAAVAVAVAASFALAAPFNELRYSLYRNWSQRLEGLEGAELLEEDSLIDPGPARILVFGMGRVGGGAYDELVKREGEVVIGIDRSVERVAMHVEAGRRVVHGDALDSDFWDRISLTPGVELVVASMSDHQANLETVRRVKEYLPNVRVAAAASFADEVNELEEAGVDVARNLFSEAGQGLADDACDVLQA